MLTDPLPHSAKHQLRLRAVDRLANVLPYTAYDVSSKEFLGEYDGALDELIAELEDCGYHYQLFAARKTADGKKDDGSYARIADEHPDAVEGTALAEIEPGECQYHVHPIKRDGVIECYGHYEVHPYPWTPTWDLTRAWPRHYRPTWDSSETPRSEWTYIRGVRDERLDSVLK